MVALEEHGELVVETRGLPRSAGLEPFLCASSAARPRPSGLLFEPLGRRGTHELPPGTWSVRLALVQEGEVVTRFGPWEQVEIETGTYTEVTLSLDDRGRR